MGYKVRYCGFCGEVSDTTGKYCQKCYNYLRIHPEGRYELPNKGEIAYATNGDAICHICGMAYRKLGNHIRFRHRMTQKTYREMFGLYHNTKLSNNEYKELMRGYTKENYNKVVKDNLINKGKKTRTSDKNILPGRKLGKDIREVKYERDK